ncbi:hypothetical protein J31TS4_19120 [Paenibacillus sp. J31TS4]|uniref:hypothetical protein n=1 Tax=Paenibacillus sp. J31TS4 TaxID=2807195 RepID=UPI001B005703|nr:hypothetical protein [Paenibacillus sp. J31TS4]GIP38632.1 hypothetical protein J31TS4_19120 [Paenibacillus sp. J31TS4]
MVNINLVVPYGDMVERTKIMDENQDKQLIAEHRNQDGSGELTFLNVATSSEVQALKSQLALVDEQVKATQETINFLLGL